MPYSTERLPSRPIIHRLRMKKGSFGYNASLLAGWTALAQALGLLAAPILTRIYSVADFGNLQLYISIFSFGFAVVAARYELAILLPEDDADAANVAVLGLGVAIFTSLGYGLLLWGLKTLRVFPSSLGSVQPYFWFIPVGMLGAGVYLLASQWALRKREYSPIASTKLVQAAGQITAQLALGGFLKAGLVGLLIGDVFGRVGGSLRLVRLIWSNGKQSFRSVSRSGIMKVARRYRSFPLISSGSALLNTAGLGLPVLMIGAMHGTTVLGWFSLVERLMNVPCAVIGQAISQVYLGEASKLLRSAPGSVHHLFLRTLGKLTLLSFGPFLAVWIFSPWLFATVFGASWREAGYYARILIPMDYVGFVVWPLMSTLNLLERQGWQLWWDGGRLALTAGSLAAIHFFKGSARLAVLAYSASMLVGYLSHLALCQRALKEGTGPRRPVLQGECGQRRPDFTGESLKN
jgi:O-antigen/teichoic acid export membrane protein